MNNRVKTLLTARGLSLFPLIIGLCRIFANACLGFVMVSGQANGMPLFDAGKKVEAVLASLPDKRFHWQQHQAMQLSGMPSYAKSFASTLLAVEAAEILSGHTDIFQRVLTLRDKIILSGLRAGWHWLAEIESAPQGSRGYVSALYVQAPSTNPPGTDRDHLFQWLPANAARKFSLTSAARPHTVTQQIYSVALDPDELLAYIERGLHQEGWTREQAFATRGSSAWRRGNARLMLFPQVSAAGTTLFVHHVQ